MQPFEKFKPYNKIFSNLLKRNTVVTMYPIVSMNIAYDSSRVTTITKADDSEYWIKMYSLADFTLTFQEKIGKSQDFGNDPEHYIKLQELE